MGSRSNWGLLAILLVALVAATIYFTTANYQQQNRTQPTSYSTDKRGSRALYEFFSKSGLASQRFEQPYGDLPANAGLLVAFEPFARPLQANEQTGLTRWLNAGGTLLLVTSPDYRCEGIGLDQVDTEQRADRTAIVQPRKVNTPFLHGVTSLRVQGTLRLLNKDPKTHQTLADDGSGGAYIVAYRQGKGSVVVTSGMPPTNESLKEATGAGADNGLFYANVALASSSSSRPIVLFDEYHQGFGLEASADRSLWDAVGAPVRDAFWYALGLFVVLIVSLNRRFGAPIRVGAPTSRPSTEYVASMAGFYRRARASDIALDMIYHNFVRFLARQSDAPPDASSERLAEVAARRFGWQVRPLADLMTRCEQIVAAEGMLPQQQPAQAKPQRLQDAELVRMVQQLQDYRRRAEIARAA